jgi:hypothetical protein
VIRSIRPFLRFGSASSATGAAAAWATFSPVHSRKLPHVPQNESASLFWNPHCLQTITPCLP